MSMAMAQQILKLERAVAEMQSQIARMEECIADLVQADTDKQSPERRGPGRPRKSATLHLPASV